MARPRKVVVTEAKDEAPMGEHDTRELPEEPTPEEAPVSVEVNEEEVPAEETEAASVEDETEKAPEDLEENEPEASNEVLFAEVGLNVHVLMNPKPIVDSLSGNKMYDVKGVVLAPGDTVPLSELPPYLVEDVKSGKVPGARFVSAEEAFRLNREAAQIRAIADQTIGVESDTITEIVSPVG